MEKQNCVCRCAGDGKAVRSARLSLALVGSALWATVAAGVAESSPSVDELRRQLAAQEAEIVALREQLARPPSLPADCAAPGAPVRTASAASAPPAAGKRSGMDDDDEELTRALESSLVRQGGGVLRPGAKEIEPEFSYLYDEPTGGGRRDRFGLALTARIGLPDAMQGEFRLPYVVRDRWSGVSTSAGVGDVQFGLSREFSAGSERAASLLGFAQWRTATGDVERNPPTGFGQQAIMFGVSTVRRQDPVVLFGSLSYTASIGSADLRDGARLRAGNVFGGRLGAYLAATPETSLYSGLAFNSNADDRFDGRRIDGSSRLSGVLELGSTTVIGRGRFLNISAGIGFTPAAPKFTLTLSSPLRF